MGFIAPYCERLYLCRRWFWTDRYFEQKRAGEIEPLAHVCVPVFVLLFNDSRCCVALIFAMFTKVSTVLLVIGAGIAGVVFSRIGWLKKND